MPAALRRTVEASEEETAPRMRSRREASASMKKLTVEPVPTPMTASSAMNLSAACAAACLPAEESVMGDSPVFYSLFRDPK